MSRRYIVFYRLDDVRESPGRCKTDHHVAKGKTIYTKHGRATVLACREDRAVDDTYRRNARVLNALNQTK